MVILLMGVTGAGKTTVGRLLAAELNWPFYDGDDFHPPANLARMARGEPLADEDRWPWLERLRDLIAGLLARDESAVVACSALKSSYRRALGVDDCSVRLVYLQGDYALIRSRLAQRRGHFAGEALLQSQFDTLQEPHRAVTIEAALEPEEIVARIRRALAV